MQTLFARKSIRRNMACQSDHKSAEIASVAKSNFKCYQFENKRLKNNVMLIFLILFFYFQRSIKRMKTSRSSLPLLRHQEPSTSAATSSSLSSQEILENSSGKPPFDIFSKLFELHEEFKESDEYTVSNCLRGFLSICFLQELIHCLKFILKRRNSLLVRGEKRNSFCSPTFRFI